MLSSKQKKKAANALRVNLSAYDKSSGLYTDGNPTFNINLEGFLDTFDQTRPVYVALENFVAQTVPSYGVYYISWENMPVAGVQYATSYTTDRRPHMYNVLGIMQGNGTTHKIATSDTLGIQLNTNQLLANTQWTFRINQYNGGIVNGGSVSTPCDIGNYMFTLVFWQKEEDVNDTKNFT